MKKLKRKFRKCTRCGKNRRRPDHSWCNECLSLQQLECVNQIRNIVFKHYGARNKKGELCCACCGETEPMFFSLDHINNDGSLMRKKLRRPNNLSGGKYYYAWLVKNNFPAEHKLQLFCMNCNHGKTRNKGVCPHKNKLVSTY